MSACNTSDIWIRSMNCISINFKWIVSVLISYLWYCTIVMRASLVTQLVKKKKSACNVGDLGSIPELVRCPGEEKCYPLQYSGLENSKDCMVRGVAKSQTRLSDFDFDFHCSYARCYTWRGLGEDAMRSFYIISYNCMWIYNYHIIEIFLNKPFALSREIDLSCNPV